MGASGTEVQRMIWIKSPGSKSPEGPANVEELQQEQMAKAMLAAQVTSPGGEALTATGHPYFAGGERDRFSLTTLSAALAAEEDPSCLEAAYLSLVQQLCDPETPKRRETMAAWCEREAKDGVMVYVLMWESAAERGATRSRPVGCVTLVHGGAHGTPIELWDVATCLVSQGRGLGRAMIAAVQSAAASIGSDLRLRAVPGARRFYSHLGFEVEVEAEGEAGSAEGETPQQVRRARGSRVSKVRL